jgi:hypothetical protein
LRHDLDSSRDTAYLDAELDEGYPGVHAVLLDRNTRFWVTTLADRAPGHELSFHYNTIATTWAQRIGHKLGAAEKPYRPALRQISPTGLQRQIRRARRRGIRPSTIHRHGPFFLYPDSIVSLDRLYRGGAGVIGSSSLSTGSVLRWGADRVDGVRGTGYDPDESPAPTAFPFRLCDASDGGRLLDGWESTSWMEPEPSVVERLMEDRLDGVPHRVVVLNFHPAHATAPTFHPGGSLPAFREVLKLCRRDSVEVRTLAEVFRVLNVAAGLDECDIQEQS